MYGVELASSSTLNSSSLTPALAGHPSELLCKASASFGPCRTVWKGTHGVIMKCAVMADVLLNNPCVVRAWEKEAVEN